MKKVMSVLVLLSVIFVLCGVGFGQQAVGRVESMKLLTPDTGWAPTPSRLFWTSDGGANWRDITPKASSRFAGTTSVFFLDTAAGWVLLSGYDQEKEAASFELATTSDGGASWSVGELHLPVDPNQYVLTGQGQLDFVDAQHGWMNLSVEGSAAANPGILLMTQDGGRSWSWAPGGSGAGRGSIRFINTQDGWSLSSSGDEIYVTHDGAKSWQELSLPAPAGLHASAQASYELPEFSDGKRGAMVVSFIGPEDVKPVLAVFVTVDGGYTWKLDKAMPRGRSGTALAITDSAWIIVQASGNQLILLGKAGAATKSDTNELSNVFGVNQLSLAGHDEGWALAAVQSNCSPERTGCTAVFSTQNRGVT